MMDNVKTDTLTELVVVVQETMMAAVEAVAVAVVDVVTGKIALDRGMCPSYYICILTNFYQRASKAV
jgi:hypothetical protein